MIHIVGDFENFRNQAVDFNGYLGYLREVEVVSTRPRLDDPRFSAYSDSVEIKMTIACSDRPEYVYNSTLSNLTHSIIKDEP